MHKWSDQEGDPVLQEKTKRAWLIPLGEKNQREITALLKNISRINIREGKGLLKIKGDISPKTK